MMTLKTLLPVFATIFLAELGDKTQLATVLFAAEAKHNSWLLFLAASAALVCSAAIAVLAGGLISKHIDGRMLSIAAGVGFIAIGAWTLLGALRGG
ncbi:MAG TPA: TMEM165/GDT1 family protein [Steroidobacter sp.]